MKLYASALAACATAMALPVQAGSFTSTIQDTVRMEVQGAGVSMTRLGSEYSASGVGVTSVPATAGATPGLFTSTAGSTPSTYQAASSDGTFQFTESYRAADATTTGFTSTQATGALTGVTLYGDATIQYAGTAGTIGLPTSGSTVATGTSMSMPLLSTTTGPNSVTATTGGPSFTIAPNAQGFIGTAQRSVSLTVFD